MTTSAPQQTITPERFFQAINAHQQSAAMRAAIELGIFTAIAEGNTTAATIARRCEASERGVRILCDYLTIHAFLTKSGETYALAPDAAMFLNQHSPAYLGRAGEFLLTERICEAHDRLTEAVRRGGTALGEGTLKRENPDWVTFARVMMPMMAMAAQLVAAELRKQGEVRKVLDIAASHGIYGIAVAKQNPEAQIYGCDWKNVLEVARENATAMGVGDRYHLLPGSAFEVEFGSGYDLVLLPNFLHHFDPPTCTQLLRKVRGALVPGGRCAIVDFIPDEDRVTPPGVAAFSMMKLATTPSGDAYTFEEFRRMATDAGFVRMVPAEAEVGMQRLVVAIAN